MGFEWGKATGGGDINGYNNIYLNESLDIDGYGSGDILGYGLDDRCGLSFYSGYCHGSGYGWGLNDSTGSGDGPQYGYYSDIVNTGWGGDDNGSEKKSRETWSWLTFVSK